MQGVENDRGDVFPVTRASMLDLAARREEAGFRKAWDWFFQGYWTPLYGWLRRTGSSRPEALDLLQDFFVEGMEGRLLGHYDRSKGRLRAYLLGCLRNIRNEARRRQMARPDRQPLPQFSTEGVDAILGDPRAVDPERAFEEEWDRQVIARAVGEFEKRLAAEKDEVSLRLLREWILPMEGRPEATALAQALGISRGDLYTRGTRLRQALAAAVEEQVRLYSDDSAETTSERDAVLKRWTGR